MQVLGRVAVVLLVASAGAGCNQLLVGQWQAIEPVRAPAGALHLKRVTFEPDGTFHAVAVSGGKPVELSGSYLLTPRTLALDTPGDPAAPSRTFHANLLGPVLRLSNDGTVIRLRKVRP